MIASDGKYRTGVARSKDLMNWEKLGVVIDVGGAGEFDELWAGEFVGFKTGTGGAIQGIYTAKDAGGNKTFGKVTLSSWTTLQKKKGPVFRPTANFWDHELELHHVSQVGDYKVLLYEAEGGHVDVQHRFWKIGIAFSKNWLLWGRAWQPLISEEAEWYAGWKAGTWYGTVHPYLVKWRDKYLLYYTEVKKAGNRWWVGNKINVALVNPVALLPSTYELYWDIWVNESITTDGKESNAITTDWPCDTTLYLFSDQDGTLEILVDPINVKGASDFRTFDTISVTANKLTKYYISYRFRRLKLKFTPVSNAIVSAFAITSPR